MGWHCQIPGQEDDFDVCVTARRADTAPKENDDATVMLEEDLYLVQLEIYIRAETSVGNDPVGDQGRGRKETKMYSVGGSFLSFSQFLRQPV